MEQVIYKSRRLLIALGFWLLLLLLFVKPAGAASDGYYYPNYDAAANGYIDLMDYMQRITVTVNGQDYTTADLQALKDAGTPLTLQVGDSISFNFLFSLCGRAYSADDPTLLDEGASTYTTYTHATTYLNGTNIPANTAAILDDSSLMEANKTKGASFLRMDISWLLNLCPGDYKIEYTDGSVSFYQDGSYLYLYFPGGADGNNYADPGYFTLTAVMAQTTTAIRVPGSDGYYVPGTDGWIFQVTIVTEKASLQGAITTYGDITVKKVWNTGGAEHPPVIIVLHYTMNGQSKTAQRTIDGDSGSARFTVQSGMTDVYLEEVVDGFDNYTSTMDVSEDGHTYTFTNTVGRKVKFSKQSNLDSAELPGAKMELYCLSSDGSQTLVDQWTSGNEPHEVTLYPGSFLLHEDLAPAGYAVSLDIPFAVRDDLSIELTGSTGSLEDDTILVTDKALTVKFAKVDAAGNPLPGAVLTLTDQNTGVQVDRWTTTAEPHTITYASENGTVLVAGHTYLLHEESAPDGYDLAADISFVFNGDGTIPNCGYYTVTMTDALTPTPTPVPTPGQPTPTPPGPASTPPGGTATPPPSSRVQTGDSPMMWVWLLLAFACFGASGCLAIWYHRRNDRPAYLRMGVRR